jgi:hypothetical protein
MARPKARTRKPHQASVSPTAWAFLNDLPMPEKHSGFELLGYRHGDKARILWDEHGEEITARWTEDHPGTRPTCWWRYSAPGLRRRVGGAGTPAHECLAYAPSYPKGIPDIWFHPEQGVDPLDPPKYESEAAFLKRLGLMSPAERKWLSGRPEALEPEVIDGGANEQ